MLTRARSTKSGARRSQRAAVNGSVNRIRSSNRRISKSPASLVSGAGEISIWAGREGKKSNDNGGTDCQLIGGPRVDAQGVLLQHPISKPKSPYWSRYK
jgi:hypothetical protein